MYHCLELSLRINCRKAKNKGNVGNKDFDKDIPSFGHNQGTGRIPLVTDDKVGLGNVSEEFISDEETEDDEKLAEEADDESEDDLKSFRDELVLTLND